MIKNKRGISPLIATVLLIGFAVALAAVVMTWGLDFIQSTADTTEQQTENTLTCATELSFTITNVDLTSGEVTVDNRGQVDISSVTFRVYTATGVTTNETIETIAKFEVKTLTPTIGGDSLVDSTVTKVEAIATVPGSNGQGDITCSQNLQKYLI
ncbi:hypothetical protein HN992_03215 [Candidatus Woesearchaeota archaeon]|jgi:flagellin-like protein|nr:hypothetical protein [Candidatus Woesearchaeota archaeon]MBT3438933.1 hypothetical protein [Candidatus Woesearchaeota archaeon]MBT4058181.1 hypothetical protein [Candidatus Woesearchaeota archaeon]MBT4731028.1 hypothetical protein [Candidatus Woesearchaeota archaeon]MBT4783538.1 hypothetical protein [Candidatus Woesearchaeota archaeon]